MSSTIKRELIVKPTCHTPRAFTCRAGTDGEVLQLEPKTGEVQASYQVGSPVRSQPAIVGVRIYVPATWLIDAARGVILRGAGLPDLWRHALVLWAMALATLTFSSLKFRKQVA